MNTVKLRLGQINLAGIAMTALVWFTGAFTTATGAAIASGQSPVNALKAGGIAGATAVGAGVYGVLVQRTKGVDGKMSFLPSFTSTDTAQGTAAPVIRLDSPDSLLFAAVQTGEVAWKEIERRKQDADDKKQAQVDAAAATAAQIADLESALTKLKAGQSAESVV